MRVTADWDLCESNGLCAVAAPQMFHVDDNDELNIANDGEVPAEQAQRVREAVRACPKMALSLEE